MRFELTIGVLQTPAFSAWLQNLMASGLLLERRSMVLETIVLPLNYQDDWRCMKDMQYLGFG